MKYLKHMKYLFALFLTLASFGSALADSRDSTVTTVPFDFVLGNTTFPAEHIPSADFG